MSDFDIAFRQSLRIVGITNDVIDAYIDYEPKSELQKELAQLVDDVLDKKFRVLTISGKQGTGKTYTVCARLEEFLYHKKDSISEYARYLTHYELDLEDKSCMNPKATVTQAQVYKNFCFVPILVIEEVGRGSTSNYTMQNIENIISKRYANKLTTILITNKTAQELREMFDASILDRIANDKEGKTFDMSGESLR